MNGLVIVIVYLITVILGITGLIHLGKSISKRRHKKMIKDLGETGERTLQFLRESGYSGGDEYLMLDKIIKKDPLKWMIIRDIERKKNKAQNSS